jgi:diacylglycerol kinase family enzyme
MNASSRRYYVILNAKAGTASALGLTAESLTEAFAAQGLDAVVDGSEEPFADRIARARDSGADVIVAAGGDGTVSAIAEAVVGTGQALAILPLGTANLLAKDLSLPLDLKQAVASLADMELREIDVGEVNGRLFLHVVSLGHIVTGPAVVREKMRGRTEWTVKLAFMRYFLHRISTARRLAVQIRSREGVDRAERVQAIAVVNNEFAEGFGRIFARDRLDAGMLSLYVLRRLTVPDFFRLIAAMLLGTWRRDAAIEIENVTSATITMRRSSIPVMIDGEVETLDLPLRFAIRPGALKVLAPPPPEQKTEAAVTPPAPELAVAGA